MPISTSTAGAFEVGIVLTALLNGVLGLQMNRYFRKPRDDLLLKSCSLATVVHLFLGLSSFHTAVITNYDGPEMVLGPTFPPIVGVEAVVHSSVQSIYTYRLYKLTGYWVFPAICLALSAYVLGSGITYTINVGSTKPELLIPTTRWQWLIYSHFSVTAGTDILIAVSTCWYLMQRRNAGLKRNRDRDCYKDSVSQSTYDASNLVYPMTLLALLNGRVPLPVEESSTTQTVETQGILESRLRIHFENGTGTNLSLVTVAHE
ncbi:hypothetical protein BD779DRAFT_1478095 [Infundibulicybe gibba]|nr:hypothetical protein BD779DRAFT_1478095 [Infundibulicybe gibba]